MSPDRMRASDSERENAVAVLRAAAAEGRLDVDELDERTAVAYAAKTRGELVALLHDIPDAALAPAPAPPAIRRRKPPRTPGRLGFSARWRAPVKRTEAVADLIEYVAPPIQAYGYTMESRTEDRMVFARETRPAWTFAVAILVFPIGLIALLYKDREQIVIELQERGEETLILAHGRGPLGVRRALTELER